MTVASVAVAQPGMSLQPYLLILGKVLIQVMSYLTALRQPIPRGRQLRDSLHYPHQLHLRNVFHNSNIFKIHEAVTILYFGRISHSHCTYAPRLTLAQYIHNADIIMWWCWYHMLREAEKDSHTCHCYSDLCPLCWCHTASTCKLKESWLDKQTPISYCICTLECNLLRQAKLRDRASLLTINFNFCCLHVFTSDQAITFYRAATHRLSSIARTLLGLQGMCGTPLLGLQKKQCTTGSPIFSVFDCTPTCSGHTLTLCQIDQRPTVIHPLNTHTTQWSHMLPVLQWNLSTVVTV